MNIKTTKDIKNKKDSFFSKSFSKDLFGNKKNDFLKKTKNKQTIILIITFILMIGIIIGTVFAVLYAQEKVNTNMTFFDAYQKLMFNFW